MDAQGQESYRMGGSPGGVADAGGGTAVEGDAGAGGIEAEDDADEGAIPEEDVELVAQQAGVSKDEAREALKAANGEPARAISDLQ